VIDAAREARGPQQARASGGRCQSLYEGRLGRSLNDVAPYLVEFCQQSVFAKWWFAQWGNSAGVLIEAQVSFDELRRHLRTLMIVNTEDRQKYYFRFYDPRVLRVFLPSCSGDEVPRFFGPITAFYCESADGNELLTFRPDGGEVFVKQSPVQLEESKQPSRAGRTSRAR